MKNLIKDSILEAKKQKKLISLNLNQDDPEKVIIGFVEDVKGNFVRLKEISIEGLEDGTSVHKLTDIYATTLDDRYNRRLEFLYKRKSLPSSNVVVTNKYNHMILDVLFTSMKKSQVTTIGFVQGYTVTGYVKKMDKRSISIMCIGYEGDYDGVSSFLIDDIDSASIDSVDNRKTDLFYKNNHSIYSKQSPK